MSSLMNTSIATQLPSSTQLPSLTSDVTAQSTTPPPSPPGKPTLTVASTQPIKVDAARAAFSEYFNILSAKCPSGIDEQPIGLQTTWQGAYNRLKHVKTFFALSFESGVYINSEGKYLGCDCAVLRTPHGFFQAHSHKFVIPEEVVQKWLSLPEQQRRFTTFGSIMSVDSLEKSKIKVNPNDWYVEAGNGLSRLEMLVSLATLLFLEYQVFLQTLPCLQVDIVDYKNVKFIDIQTNLLNRPADLIKTVEKLTRQLIYNYVILADARGFLFCSYFASKGIPCILARKENKLPKEVVTSTYNKEYGQDSICIEKNALPKGSRVLVIDDLLATGGTLQAITKLVESCGSEVAGYITPFAIEDEKNPGNLILNEKHNLDMSKVRFARTQLDDFSSLLRPEKAPTVALSATYPSFNPAKSQVHIVPPSLQTCLLYGQNVAPIKWGHFSSSPNIQLLEGCFYKKDVTVFINALNQTEAIEVLSVLKILHRKDPKSITVVIPFMEPATQDRIEYKDNYETVAMIDTFSKLLGKYKTITFDLHAEQSQFAFHDLRNESLVKRLWTEYTQEKPVETTIPCFPDEGSAKRFSKLLNINLSQAVCFRKVRGPGDTRIVSTDDPVVKGARYVIIDDLVRSGSTMHSVAKYLLDRGAKAVDALFAHAALEPSCAKYLYIFDRVFTTDSCPDTVPTHWVKVNVMSACYTAMNKDG